MKCVSCGAQLTDSVYCPICGCDNSVQKQAIVLSGLYYNQGLEKAQIRDLSGAIEQLKRSLKFNKLNIQARNLLGLVYFETGEVVSALSEWVISKNIQPEENLAAAYISNLQKDAGKLDVINQTIKKFNIALGNAQDGNEDVAKIQLKKVLAQNPKLIKGYHLLALLYMKDEEYDRARKLLRKALKIDRTNTTTLRYMREIDEAAGAVPETQGRFLLLGRRNRKEEEETVRNVKNNRNVLPPFLREHPFSAGSLGLLLGLIIGAIAAGILFIPAARRSMNRETNEKIAEYSQEAADLRNELAEKDTQVSGAQQTADISVSRLNEAVAQASAYEQLSAALKEYYDDNEEAAAEHLAAVDPSLLSESARSSYDKMANDMRSLLFEKLKESGITKLNSGDMQGAVSTLTRAAELNGDNEEVQQALTQARDGLAQQQEQEGNVKTIPAQEG